MSHLWIASALLAGVVALGGCGGGQPVEAVWSMPDVDPDPDAQRPRGYPFVYASPVRLEGADATGAESEERHAGDLPETGLSQQPSAFWVGDEARAIREARETGRGLLVDFYAEWCDACRLLDHDTLRDFEVRDAIRRRYVPLRIDVTEETFASRDQLQRYRVVQLPAIVMLDERGAESDRIEQYVPPAVMLRRIEGRTSDVAQ